MRRTVLVDLGIVVVVLVLSTAVGAELDLFEMLYDFSRAHEDWEIDEIVPALVTLIATLGWFAFRRWREARVEIRRRDAVETALRKAEDDLQRALRLKEAGQIAGGVAHEFNNIMAVVLGNLELLDDKSGDAKASAAHLERARRAILRAKDLTDQLLSYSQRKPLKLEPVDPAAVVLAAMEKCASPHIDLVPHDIVPGRWQATSDDSELEFAVVRLIDNAIKASPSDGNVDIRVYAADVGPDAEADDLATGPYVCIDVRDYGAGMTSDVRDRAIEPFFSTRNVGDGPGLGLSMAYGYARQSDGTVRLDSTPGQGTTVRLYLPRVEG